LFVNWTLIAAMCQDLLFWPTRNPLRPFYNHFK
jgi:hypothetical protein